MRIANHLPVKCSSCYGQKPGHAHVDFESAFNGPLVDPDRPRAGHIDWLVICDDCVRSAYELLPEVRGRREQMEEELAATKAALAEEQNFSQRLEDAVAARPMRRAQQRGPKTAKKQAA